MSEQQPAPQSPPPRAFTQGVGTIFQFTGIGLFIFSMFICCSSSLLSKDFTKADNLTKIGWFYSQTGDHLPFYSAQRAVAISLTCSVVFGMGLAGIGLGLQALNRRAPILALVLTFFASTFWIVQTIFSITVAASWLFSIFSGVMSAIFIVLCGFAIAAAREMSSNPPPPGHEILPADYKIPYSHLHQDPPEVRIARELDERRQKLAVQQKELEMLEEKLKKKLKD
jgi:hypothetical protein